MRRFVYVVVAAAAVTALARPAAAQVDNGAPIYGASRQMPAAGAIAVGGEGGFFLPSGGLDVGPAVAGLAEFYFIPRVAIRGRVGTASTGFSTSDDALRRTWGAVDVLYNWESGLWHPFVAVGAGAVRLRQSGTGYELVRTRAMISLGGGVEYFARPRVTLKFEGSYFRTGTVAPVADPWGYTLTAGIKRYF